MRNTLKMLGIICIIVSALFIAACGDLPLADNVYTVTFNSDGGSTVSPKTVPADGTGTVSKPANPTKGLTEPGLYKNSDGYTFVRWELDGVEYDFGTSVTSDITLKATWTLKGEKATLSGSGDVVTQAFAYINTATIANDDKYTLYITANVSPTVPLVLNKSKANLTIISSDPTKNITSPDLSGVTGNKVFITIGAGANPTPSSVTTLDKTVSLTLKNVAVVGRKKATGDSLIRVMNGATLTLDANSFVQDHINSAGGFNGANGNGSAICVINGSTLNIKQGAIIENNQSTSNQENKNLVGGIYVIGSPVSNPAAAAQNRSTVKIEGGSIGDPVNGTPNKCTDGNTADIYITELVDLDLNGNVTIGELCINSDNGIYPGFTISGKVTNTIRKFNLRSTTGSLKAVQDAWTATNAKVFSGTADYDITRNDVAQFKLWEFTGNTSLRGDTSPDSTKWKNLIYPAYEIDIVDKSGSTPSYGRLLKANP